MGGVHRHRLQQDWVSVPDSDEARAIVGGGGNEEIEALSDYGKYLGIAYQVHDDILDWGTKDKVTLALKQGEEESRS